MDVAIAPCQTYDRDSCLSALRAVLAPFGGLAWVQPGMKIAVKTNLVSMLKPEAAATTHPALLCALTELLRGRGAEVIVGDSPGGLYTSAYVNAVYRGTGVTQVERWGARLNQDFSQAKGEMPDAAVMKTFQYTAWLDGCDAVIDFCKLKSHGMMAMSAAAKNMFGTIPGTMKPEYHFRFPNARDFADMIVDLAEYWKPRLSIVDAVVGMEGNGPTAGTPRAIGCLLAGESPHKVDLVCASVLGIARSEIPTLEAARARGLIPDSVQDLEIAGDINAFLVPDFQKIETKNGILFQDNFHTPLGRFLSPFMMRHIASRPQVCSPECIGCQKCAQVCPAKAIGMRRGKPKIDRRLCIRCFCCQEFCPRGAMKVVRPPLARLLNK